jgi:hypothetical protein
MNRTDVIAAIRATPAQVQRYAQGLNDAQLRERVEPNEWTVLEIVAHLRDAEELLAWRIDKVLTEEHPTFAYAGVDERVRAHDYNRGNLRDYVDEFAARRAKIVAQLEALSEADWARTAFHQTYGELTMQGVVEIFVNHDAEHLRQLQRIVERLRA